MIIIVDFLPYNVHIQNTVAASKCILYVADSTFGYRIFTQKLQLEIQAIVSVD